jgi:hypothetical protein
VATDVLYSRCGGMKEKGEKGGGGAPARGCHAVKKEEGPGPTGEQRRPTATRYRRARVGGAVAQGSRVGGGSRAHGLHLACVGQPERIADFLIYSK